MSKRARDNSATNVQLFPFLAVLLCAMGGLILLLVIITGKNRAVGKVLSQAMLEQRIELAAKRNEVELEVEIQSDARERTAQQLSGRRAALAQLEEQARKVRDEIAELEAAAVQLQKNQQAEKSNVVQLEQQIAQLDGQTKLKEEELKKLREKIRLYEDSFAVVPYEGPNSTRRRPIYIECVADAVILQPEGIRLSEDDFVFSQGPNNPLAAALRAGRDYLVTNRYVGGKDNGDPYPLLLVRPEGIGAYYAARHAMTSWGAEFGYELIEADWKVSYRPVDPGLTLAMTRAVDDARARGLAMAKAAPGLLDPEQRKLYRTAFAAGRGGMGGSGLGSGGAGDGDSMLGNSAGGARKGRFSTGFTGNGDGDGQEEGSGGIGARGGGRGYGPSGAGDGTGAYSGTGKRNGDDPSTLPYGNIGVNGQPGKAGQGASSGTGNGLASNNSPNAGANAAVNGGAANGPGGGNASGAAAGGGGAAGAASNGGSSNANSFATPGKGYAQSAGGAAEGGSPSSSEPGSSGEANSSVTANVDASQTATVTVTPQSLANKRGRDWGLTEKARSAVPLTRPISVQVTSKEFVLLSETGNPLENRKVVLKPRTEESIDDFVKQIWTQVESWNLAGAGMYWRPVIVANVTPDGQQRFADLQALMADSGLEVKQKEVARRSLFPRR